MRIWLDDVREVPKGFIHVHNLKELKMLLEISPDEVIEEMSFDHDLGLNTPDGYEIIKWLARKHPDRWPKEVRSHSANPIGRENIEAYDRLVREKLFPQREHQERPPENKERFRPS